MNPDNLCPKCKLRPSTSKGSRQCRKCTARLWREKRRLLGLCGACCERAVDGRVFCDRHLARARLAGRARPAQRAQQAKRSYEYKKYGITSVEYHRRLIAQGHRCAICGTPSMTLSHRLCVDHDHYTGEIRGLLCKRCNLGLGQFDDDLFSVLQASNYLLAAERKQPIGGRKSRNKTVAAWQEKLESDPIARAACEYLRTQYADLPVVELAAYQAGGVH